MTRSPLPFLICLFFAACSHAPDAPTVDGSQRIPVNDAATISMLQRGFSVSTTTSASALSTSASLSRVFRYHFPVGGSGLNLSPSELADLMPLARQANKIIVRARTDANVPNEADLLTAQRRAESAKRVLIANRVPANKIMLNYVSAGDYLGDNATVEGRALNRRVEIEVFGQH